MNNYNIEQVPLITADQVFLFMNTLGNQQLLYDKDNFLMIHGQCSVYIIILIIIFIYYFDIILKGHLKT